MITANDGALVFNTKEYRWEREDGSKYVNGKDICKKCGKPRLDINNVKDCDFCLQGLSTCEFIDYACCGHGNDELAYISLKDGRRFVLDRKKGISGEIIIGGKSNDINDLNIPTDEVKEIVTDYKGRTIGVYYIDEKDEM